MTNAEVQIRTKFRLDLQPKVVVLTDDIDYTSAGDNINDFVGVIQISGPNGLIYENTDFDNPDIVPGTSRQSLNQITLPVDSQDSYQVYDGTYTVKYTIRDNNTLITYEETFVYGFYYNEPTMVLDVESGPFTATLRSRDLTNYGSNIETLTRVHRLHYPEGILPAPPADIVTALDEYTVDPAYTNLWEISVETTVSYKQADKLEYEWIGSVDTEHCVFGSCLNQLYDVLEVMFDAYIDYTTTNPTKATQFRERLIKVNAAFTLLDIAWRAGDYEDADKQVNIIQDQVRLSGITTCSQGGTSVEVVPCGPWGGSGVVPASYTFQNGISEAAGVVILGGALTKDTNIVAGGYHFDVSGASAGHTVQLRADAVNPNIVFSADDGSVQGRITAYENGVDLEYNDLGTPANSRKYLVGSSGLIEGADYSAGYVLRSLVSKEYVDGNQNWGAQVVQSDATLSGNGTVANPLGVQTPFSGFTSLLADYGYLEPTHAFSEITDKPTTIAGYGITDAVTAFLGLSDTPADYVGHGGKLLAVNAGATAIEFISSSGYVPDTGGTFTGQVIIFTDNDYPLVLKQSNIGETAGSVDASVNQIQFQDNDGDIQGVVGIDATGNLILGTNVSGQLVQVQDSFEVQGDITLTGTVDGVDIAAFKTDYDSHSHAFVDITAKPTTLSGYGITDAMLNTDASWLTEFTSKAGATISDRLVIEDVAASGGKKYITVGDLPSSAATFLALSDAPSSYVGAGGYVVRVNAGATALEFTDFSGLHISTSAGTLNAYTEKVLPTINDVLIIEDAADGYNQKKIFIGNLPSSGGGGSGTSLYYRFDNTTTKADPTAGRFRFNNATLSSVTEIYVDDIGWNAIDLSSIIETLSVGNYLYIQQLDSSSHVAIYEVTAVPVDETGYYTIGVSYVSDGGAGPDNGSDCGFMIEAQVASYTFSDSLVLVAGDVNLVNDEASPLASSYYGTNGAGVREWISFAHGSSHESGGSDTINHDNLIGFVANEHIDWTATAENLSTSGSVSVNTISEYSGAAGVTIDGVLIKDGNVDGRDVSADGAWLDTLYTTIGLSALTSAEVDQLENIGVVEILAVQWGYLGALDQPLTQASSPTFTALTISGDLTVDTDTLYVDSADSRVGIGTIAPSYALDVAGSFMRVSGSDFAAVLIRDTGTGGASWELWSGLPSAGDFKIRGQSKDPFKITGTIYDNSLVIDNGNVGIGTTSPTNGKLEISDGVNATGSYNSFALSKGTSYGTTQFNTFYTASGNYGTTIGGILTTNVGSGNVGIGTTSPSAKLDVDGDINISSGSQYRINGVAIGGVSGSDSQIPYVNAAGDDFDYSSEFVWSGNTLLVGNTASIVSRGISIVTDSLNFSMSSTGTVDTINGWHDEVVVSHSNVSKLRIQRDDVFANEAAFTFESGDIGVEDITKHFMFLDDNVVTTGTKVRKSFTLEVDGVEKTTFFPRVANGGTALGYLFDTATSLSTAGAEIVAFRNAGTDVLTVDHAGNVNIPTGAEYRINGVAVGGATSLDDLSDVTLGTLSHGDVLYYNSASDIFMSASPPGAGLALSGHGHGDINSYGRITSTAITPASGDYILLSDTGSSGAIKRGIVIGANDNTYLRKDGNWGTPAGSGDVTAVGTPADNQIAVWTGASAIEGSFRLTYKNISNVGTLNLDHSDKSRLDLSRSTVHHSLLRMEANDNYTAIYSQEDNTSTIQRPLRIYAGTALALTIDNTGLNAGGNYLTSCAASSIFTTFSTTDTETTLIAASHISNANYESNLNQKLFRAKVRYVISGGSGNLYAIRVKLGTTTLHSFTTSATAETAELEAVFGAYTGTTTYISIKRIIEGQNPLFYETSVSHGSGSGISVTAQRVSGSSSFSFAIYPSTIEQLNSV